MLNDHNDNTTDNSNTYDTNMIGNLIESLFAHKSLSLASIFWYVGEKRKCTVSSNSRF